VTYKGTPEQSILYGTAEGDLAHFDGGDDVVWALAGDDTVFGGGGDDRIMGGDGNDSLQGDGAHAVLIPWSDGNDTIDGQLGDDVIHGGGGWDVISGGSGNDSLFGGAQADVLYGSRGDDLLEGGAGADLLVGGADLASPWGRDTASYASSPLRVIVDLSTGRGTGGDAEGDRLVHIQNLVGSSHSDTLTGDAAANRIEAGSGWDLVTGGGGADLFVVYERPHVNETEMILDFSTKEGDRLVIKGAYDQIYLEQADSDVWVKGAADGEVFWLVAFWWTDVEEIGPDWWIPG
jgi:Ca2+-binding RTX toxin-like protein